MNHLRQLQEEAQKVVNDAIAQRMPKDRYISSPNAIKI